MTEQKSSRRRFLGGAAGTAGVAMALVSWRSGAASAATLAEGTSRELTVRPLPGGSLRSASKRGFTAGRFALDIGKDRAGWVMSVEGGHATSDVVAEKMGADHIVHKHIGGVKYEDIEIHAGTGMSKSFYSWVNSAFDNNRHVRQDGAIHSCDYDGKIVSTLEFFHGLISEIGFPALDAASKDDASITFKLAPEYTRFKLGTGKLSGPFTNSQQKRWLPANFRLKLDGLDCTRVSRIEPLVLRQPVTINLTGDNRDLQGAPAPLEIPDLRVTLPLANAQSFLDWHEDFVIKGNNGQDKEKTGSLEFLATDLKEVLFTLTFRGVGIYALDDGDDDSAGDADNIKRIRAEMYCEEMSFSYGANST